MTELRPQLIAGLGNPGKKYQQTRHNIGFEAIDALAKAWQIPLSENRRFKGIFGEGFIPKTGKIRLLKPTTYMNRSGQSLQSVVSWLKIPPESVLAIYDDMDLPVGKIRLRLSGSAGGHNGMKSAIAHLNTQDFPRLRIGIGKPTSDNEQDITGYVLGKFSPSQAQVMSQVLDTVVEAIEVGCEQGWEKAMSMYNNQIVTL